VKLNKKNKGMLSRVLVWGAVISVLFSIVGWMGSDIWLASTQWLLVAGRIYPFCYLSKDVLRAVILR